MALSKSVLKATLRALEARQEPCAKMLAKYTTEAEEIREGVEQIRAELDRMENAA